MSTVRQPGQGQDAPGEAERLALIERQARARKARGAALLRALDGSRSARRGLGERMGAVTAANWAGDRRNEARRG